MRPKIDLKTLSEKRDNAIYALNELFVEFETLYSVKPEVNLLAAVKVQGCQETDRDHCL